MQSGTCTTRREGGFVLVVMALAAFALFGMLGLSIDLGRVYVAKNETQTFCDSAAVSAALKLNGTTSGITNAQTAVNSNVNTWNLNTSRVSSPLVDFATAISGPWVTNPAAPAGYRYVRVRATGPVNMYFLPLVINQFTQNVQSTAIAAQVTQNGFKQGLAPYTAIAQDPANKDNFGFTQGGLYDIQWPASSNGGGCSTNQPKNCFKQSLCKNESDNGSSSAAGRVVQYWGSSNSGYWGASSASQISQEVLDVIQKAPVNLGDNIQPVLTNGDKNSEGPILDNRVNQDTNLFDNDPVAYLRSANHNGRRIIAVPIVNPVSSSETDVVGFAAFLLQSDATGTHDSQFYRTNNGNEAYCAAYVGAYVQGSMDPGAAGGGTYRVMLVQ